MTKWSIVFLLIFSSVFSIHAQEKTGLPCLNKTLSINVHIIKNKLGSPGITEVEIKKNIDSLNKIFDTICLQFKVCNIDYNDNFQYDDLDVPGSTSYKTLTNYKVDWLNPSENKDMISKIYVPNTINLYFVTTLYKNDKEVAGYASLPGGPDIIVLTKKSKVGVYAHEFGHYMGLLHTFETKHGDELVRRDTLNVSGKPLCELTGDFLCDTEADYNPNQELIPLNGECQYLLNSKDATGQFYMPPTNNIMSYFTESCKTQFTPEQYKRMAQQYLTARTYLW